MHVIISSGARGNQASHLKLSTILSLQDSTLHIHAQQIHVKHAAGISTQDSLSCFNIVFFESDGIDFIISHLLFFIVIIFIYFKYLKVV